MKKTFTLLAATFAALMAGAADYTETIMVSVNGVGSEQTGVISVTDTGDGYDLALKNFVLNSADGPMGVGNIELHGLQARQDGTATLLSTQETITITPGDDSTVPFWMAQMLPPVPVELRGKLEDGHLRCYIDIDLQEAMGQTIQVAVGSGYQLRNQGFEDWHTSTDKYMEPNGWHSFETATGSLASAAGHHIERSEDAHSGDYSARIFATSLFGIVANGTMTTGRMNAGSMFASNSANNAYADTSLTDTDGNGDPFYTPLYAQPDSIAFWVKYKKGKANAQHPYATLSAIITDGTYYQDPEDKDYSNVVAKAQNTTISETGDQWVRVVAPFVYTDNGVSPKAILVTLSTNADAGQGAGGDEMFIDDGELIYNTALTSLTVGGEAVEGFDPARLEYELTSEEPLTADAVVAVAAGRSARIVKTVTTDADYQQCLVTVYGGDMAKTTTYTLKAPVKATAISSVETAGSGKPTYYTLDGRRAASLAKGRTYIRRQADGHCTIFLSK